jgi:hypothetical protein
MHDFCLFRSLNRNNQHRAGRLANDWKIQDIAADHLSLEMFDLDERGWISRTPCVSRKVRRTTHRLADITREDALKN